MEPHLLAARHGPAVTNDSDVNFLARFASGLTGVDQPANYMFVHIAAGLFGLVTVFVVYSRLSHLFTNYLRLVQTVGGDTRQTFWSHNSSSWAPWLKRNIIYAPLGRVRHNNDIYWSWLSKAHAVCTLPGRLDTVLLCLYCLTNIAYCLVLPWDAFPSQSVVAALRGRSGVLATFNLIPTVLFGMRNNPLIWSLNISYDTFNLFHRWCARMCIIQSVVHMLAWLVNTLAAGGAENVRAALATKSYLYGLISGLSFILLLLHSPAFIRHAFYDTFLNFHRLLAVVAFVGLYVHLDDHKLPQLPWMYMILGIYGGEWFIRVFRIWYHNISISKGMSNVFVEALPGEACRVRVDCVEPFHANPGSHAHLYFPSISNWMSHPFSIAWLDNARDDLLNVGSMETAHCEKSLEREGNADHTNDLPDFHATRTKYDPPSKRVHFVLRARTGLTRKLYDLASAQPGGVMELKGMIEGPYGGHDRLSSYGTAVLFAGGVGITHQVPHVKHLVQGYFNGLVATRKILLVWTVQTVECLEWVKPWMDELLALPGRCHVLKIELYITRPKNHKKVVSKSGGVTRIPGRCNPGTVLDLIMAERVGATAVTVCGPGVFADSVRKAVRDRVHLGVLDFIEEAFSY